MATATDTATETLPLIALEIHNFVRLEALTIDANGGHVDVFGKNKVGKTSAADALFFGLRGPSAKKIPEPLHHGADNGSIDINLGDEYFVKRTVTAAGHGRLTVKDRDGQEIKRPQEFLDALCSRYSLNPIRFMQQSPADQLDDFLRVYNVQPPVEDVERITGERFDPLPGESAARYLDRLAADKTGALYVRRHDAGRVADKKKKARDEQGAMLEEIGGPLSAEEQPKSLSDLIKQTEKLRQKEDAGRQVQLEAERTAREHEDLGAKLVNLGNDRSKLAKERDDLQRRLDEVQAAIAGMDERITRGQVTIAESKADAAAAAEALRLLPDPAPEIAALRQKIETVEADNAKVARRKMAFEQLEQLRADWEKADGDHKTCEGTLESVRQLRAHLLDGVELDVDGLSVGCGELRLNDYPLSQASTAEQLGVAMALAMREKPTLALLRLDGAECLDTESRALAFKMASDRGFQCFMTRVADTPGLGFEIIDAGAVAAR